MEVWALEAYGASYTLQEMLTVNLMMFLVEQKPMKQLFVAMTTLNQAYLSHLMF